MKYIKRYNENLSSLELGDIIVASIRSEIEDILIDFLTYYDIRFVQYDLTVGMKDTIHSKDNFQLQIIPKIAYNEFTDNSNPILIDTDILNDLKRVCKFIESELNFTYSHSYYFINNNYNRIHRDIFYAEGEWVNMIHMYFVGTKGNPQIQTDLIGSRH